jgi:hypothetical protein
MTPHNRLLFSERSNARYGSLAALLLQAEVWTWRLNVGFVSKGDIPIIVNRRAFCR